jgi:5-formyltetrahydrofolate cyclo-ligase
MRRDLLAVRRSVAPEVRRRWSAAICASVCGSPAFDRALHLVAYAPIGAEVDPSDAAVAALQTGRRLYYPVGVDEVAIRESRRAGGGAAGPVPDGQELAAAADRILFLVPGVAFDMNGNRLGRGRGWYDRVLARFGQARRVGLAFDLQIVADVPHETWDVPMDAVVTPTRTLPPGRSFEPSEGTPRC